MKTKDKTNKKFGRLVAIKRVGTASDRQSVWLCQCDCGNSVEVKAGNLNSGNTNSCGCLSREVSSQIFIRVAIKNNFYRGENNPAWRGGKTSKLQLIRRSKPYKEWRCNVFVRDNFTCQFCKKKGGVLHADHIKPFADYPDLRMDESNGRTLCVPCHKKTDTFGFKKQKLCQQLI